MPEQRTETSLLGHAHFQARFPAVIAPVVTGVAAVAAAVAVHLIDPNQPGHYPTCPFLAVTSLYCPGCGTLRALHALTNGDLGRALAMNPATLIAIPYLVWTWACWLRRTTTGHRRRWMAPPWLMWAVTVAIGLFWVLRNLPGFGFLGPA